MKVINIVGARPQIIKASVISRALRKTGKIREILLHTGQHYDKNMSAIFFRELEMPIPQYNLCIGSGLQGLQTGKMLEAIEKVLLFENPDLAIVYGDTNSTLAGALSAAKLHIPVAHIEAGLRSFNKKMPEEINRILTDHVSELLFTPTMDSVGNLKNEGIPKNKIYHVGDVMYDVALHYGKKAEQVSRILAELQLSRRDYILSTIHRPENTEDIKRLSIIFSAFLDIAKKFTIVMPLHPRTRKKIAELRLDLANLTIIDPIGYLDMLILEKNARLIITDSGGIQKEAYFYAVPCVTLRDQTEWMESVKSGGNLLTKVDSKENIIRNVFLARKSQKRLKIYGGGKSADKIVDILNSYCKDRKALR